MGPFYSIRLGQSALRILMIGDIIGKPGRQANKTLLPDLRQELSIDMVIANGENTAGGFGITLETAYELLDSGVDVLTSGNHIWDQREIIPHMDDADVLHDASDTFLAESVVQQPLDRRVGSHQGAGAGYLLDELNIELFDNFVGQGAQG